MQMPQHIELALRDYDRRRDRSTPPVFVGRADELNFLRGTVAAAKAGAKGVTAVVQGVPGVGKSALCTEFEKELQTEMSEEAPVVVLPKESSFFDSSPVSMVQELAAEVPVRMDLLRGLPGFGNLREHVGRAVGVTTALLKRGSPFDLAMQAMGLNQSSSLGAVLDAFAENLWPAGVTLILSIDETQGIQDAPQVRSNLQAIHAKRFSANIAILAFGLQDTAAKLSALGLSRLGSGQIRRLGRMTSLDAASLVDRTFDHLRLTSEDEDWRKYARECGFDIDAWTQWRNAAKAVVSKESVDFPHHLVNGIRGVCQIVLGGLRHPGQAELGVLRRLCLESKDEYYRARLEPFANHTMAVAAALQKTNEAGEVDEGVLQSALEKSDNRGRATNGETAAAVLDDLIGRGLLIRRRTTMVGVEIPSLTSYLTAEFHGALTSGGVAAGKLASALQIDAPMPLGNPAPRDLE